MRTSLELVPRSANELESELTLASVFSQSIDTINIPDLPRFDVRSYEGSILAQHFFKRSIPHLRAVDYSLDEPFPLLNYFKENCIREILIIEGDPDKTGKRKSFPTKPVELIRKLRQEASEIRLYAAIDPYRTSISQELEYIAEKKEAGAEGFFTQPYFDRRLLEIFAEKVKGLEVFWGVSPVTSDKSRVYWESRNRAVFPSGFQATPEWNIAFARDILSFCRQTGFNLYLMPIKVDLKEYLEGVFELL